MLHEMLGSPVSHDSHLIGQLRYRTHARRCRDLSDLNLVDGDIDEIKACLLKLKDEDLSAM